MTEWGLNPKSYAYPGARGYDEDTQLANKRAGFICARGYTLDWDEFYICPDEESKPQNWYYLPAVPIAKDFDKYVNTHDNLQLVMEKNIAKKSWIIFNVS